MNLPVFDDGWKSKCRTCLWLDDAQIKDGVWRCSRNGRPTIPKPFYCIDQRDVDGPCGPDASLWEPQE